MAEVQHRLAREHGYPTWPAMVRDLEMFEPAVLEEIPWERIRTVTVVCFPTAGEVTLLQTPTRRICSHGDVQRGEDVWDDSVHRITMETMGFRRQGTHAFALDERRRHVAFWVDGGPYTGSRPHATDAETVTLPLDEAVDALREQGDGALARLVAAADHDRVSMSYERHSRELQRTLTGAYLRSTSRAGGSGFGGDEHEWRQARFGLTAALEGLADQLGRPHSPVSLLDVGCANGHLGASFVEWGAERGVAVEPYGVDVSPELLARARELYPQWAQRFWCGDALEWRHPDGLRFDVVHALLDVVPDHLHAETVANLLHSTTPGGRLLLSNYDTREEHSARTLVTALGYDIAGVAPLGVRRVTGRPYATPSVWITAPPR